MKARDESKLNMYRAVEKHGDNNPTIVSIIPAFAATFIIFKTKISEILSALQKEQLVTKGITKDKFEAKKNLSLLAAEMAAPIFAYAAKTNNNTLKQQANFNYTNFLKTKDDLLAPSIRNIIDAATNNLPALISYGISAAALSALKTSTDSYQSKVANPRAAATAKTTIRTNLKTLFAETDIILKEQLDKTIVSLKTSNPDFVSTYTANRVIIDPRTNPDRIKRKYTKKSPITSTVINP